VKAKNIKILHLGISGFPFGTAAINKCLTVYEALAEEEFEIFIMNDHAVHNRDIPYNIQKIGKYNQLNYFYTTPSPYKPSFKISRIYYIIVGKIIKYFLLIKWLFKKKIDLIIFYPRGNFFELFNYRILSLIFNVPIISHYVEYRSVFLNRKKIRYRINDYLFDHYFMYFVDGVLPISEFLIQKIKNKKQNLPILKIPPLVNYNSFKKINNIKDDYFLYVGSTGYYESIELVVKAFCLIPNNRFYLYLILNQVNFEGTIQKLKSKYNNQNIKFFSQLEYDVLINYYFNAKALLVPLNNNIKDIARFPHKIAEYLATANPIITTNFGEIPYYFEDEKNALVTQGFNCHGFAQKMQFVINNKDSAVKIGLNGYNTGFKYFNSLTIKKKLSEFVLKIIES